MRLAALAALAAVFTFTGCASFNAPPTLAPLEAKAGDYKLDPHHTTVLWKVDHLGGLSKFVGRFDKIDGAMVFDPEHPESAKIDIRIDAASVSTSVPGFSETIAKTIFDAKDHPEIQFVSSNITELADSTGVAHGELTMRGVTRAEDIQIRYNGSKINPLDGKETIGFAASGTIKRSDYGATAWSLFGVGDKIDLEIHTEFVKSE
jgi:polyisoprenoid-binding protein YceI